LDVPFDAKAAKEQFAANSPREWQLCAVPVKVVFAHSHPAGCFLDRQQFIRSGRLRGCRRNQPSHCCGLNFRKAPSSRGSSSAGSSRAKISTDWSSLRTDKVTFQADISRTALRSPAQRAAASQRVGFPIPWSAIDSLTAAGDTETGGRPLSSA